MASFEQYVASSLGIRSGIGVGIGGAHVHGKFDQTVKFGSSPLYLRWGFVIPAEVGRGLGDGLPVIIGSTSEHRMAEDSMIQEWMREVLGDSSYKMSQQDRLDVEFCAVGDKNVYDAMVLPWIQGNAQPPVDPGQPPAGGDPCADVKAELQQAVAHAVGAQRKLDVIGSSANKARKVLPSGPGGGKYAVALRTLIGDIDAQVKG